MADISPPQLTEDPHARPMHTPLTTPSALVKYGGWRPSISPRRIYHDALLHAGTHGAVISVLERVDKPEVRQLYGIMLTE